LVVEGSRRRVVVDEEMAIRGLLGVGSLRSTLFVMETDYGPTGRPVALAVTGGGWGHGVGLCQSGAMGRAEAGETYAEIIKSYFKGTEFKRLDY
jgi:SpoIID/LytB domain protein